jgi:hypothetical protein
VLGADELNLEILRGMQGHERQTFVPLLSPAEMQHGEVSIPDLLDRAVTQLDERPQPVDAIVGFWNFPVSTLVPLLAARYGLRSASLESVVMCEHKYWSRLAQQQVIDDHPPFGLVDIHGGGHLPDGVGYPVWLKPVKSYSSELAFHVSDDEQLATAVAEIRDGIGRLGRPFEEVLDRIDLPPAIAEVWAARRASPVHDCRVVVHGVLGTCGTSASTPPGRGS